MKAKITVGWSNTVEVDVDMMRMHDDSYLDEVRSRAAAEASNNIDWKGGVVTDCEDFPQMVE